MMIHHWWHLQCGKSVMTAVSTGESVTTGWMTSISEWPAESPAFLIGHPHLKLFNNICNLKTHCWNLEFFFGFVLMYLGLIQFLINVNYYSATIQLIFCRNMLGFLIKQTKHDQASILRESIEIKDTISQSISLYLQ